MWQPHVQVVNAVIWLMQQCKRYQLTNPVVGDDASRPTPDRVPRQPDVFNVLSPALKIARDPTWENVDPQKVIL